LQQSIRVFRLVFTITAIMILLCNIKGPVFAMGTGCVLRELQTEF